ncbi:hypothetical protein BUALT_Bualt13G0034300 [Buddleja alternifolia]|uniref:Uncharacterized protein n=1 Tax=Buddleja alternifolia TaxID=168488 RepID=A0AAV6WVC6_9LAMI|nr:hypothetical protein BUALT_Bualt13G0034300 [Buddleja alternifolia]
MCFVGILWTHLFVPGVICVLFGQELICPPLGQGSSVRTLRPRVHLFCLLCVFVSPAFGAVSLPPPTYYYKSPPPPKHVEHPQYLYKLPPPLQKKSTLIAHRHHQQSTPIAPHPHHHTTISHLHLLSTLNIHNIPTNHHLHHRRSTPITLHHHQTSTFIVHHPTIILL